MFYRAAGCWKYHLLLWKRQSHVWVLSFPPLEMEAVEAETLAQAEEK